MNFTREAGSGQSRLCLQSLVGGCVWVVDGVGKSRAVFSLPSSLPGLSPPPLLASIPSLFSYSIASVSPIPHNGFLSSFIYDVSAFHFLPASGSASASLDIFLIGGAWPNRMQMQTLPTYKL